MSGITVYPEPLIDNSAEIVDLNVKMTCLLQNIIEELQIDNLYNIKKTDEHYNKEDIEED